MRLLETLTVPGIQVFGNGNGYDYFGEIIYQTGGAISIHFTPGAFSSPTDRIKYNFSQPRVGRSFTVDQMIINPIGVIQVFYAPPLPANQFAINFELSLNDVIVSPIKSLVYEITADGSGIPVDLTDQNGTVSVEPFNSLKVLSGDSLRVEISFGFETIPPGVFFSTMKTQFSLQLIGENGKAVALRNE